MANLKVKNYPVLSTVTSTTVDTAAGAYYLNRRSQTLRKWACYGGTGPLQPIRVNGRLAWFVSDIRRLLKGGE